MTPKVQEPAGPRLVSGLHLGGAGFWSSGGQGHVWGMSRGSSGLRRSLGSLLMGVAASQSSLLFGLKHPGSGAYRFLGGARFWY